MSGIETSSRQCSKEQEAIDRQRDYDGGENECLNRERENGARNQRRRYRN
jgi:hypothetical protein